MRKPAHDYLRTAVAAKYLPSKVAQQTAHLDLAAFFSGRERDSRQVDELPWQLQEGSAWDRLYALLADLPSFEAVWHDVEWWSP